MKQTMIEIDGKIISTDILTTPFLCDLKQCRGLCCVEGTGGAPLADEEIDILEREYDNYSKYMMPEGREIVEKHGFMVVDDDGEYSTPLIEGADCVFSFQEDGVAYCAIERAFKNGECGFRKPVSCHLYPVRVKRFKNGSVGLNYNRWDICSSALECGKKLGVPMYKMLQEAIVRAFGQDFYDALGEAENYLNTLSEEDNE